MSHDILLVDDDPGTIHAMGRMLAGVARQRFATDGATALRVARECRPDLMLLDAEMPGMSGFQVCQAMKDDPELRDVPVIFVTSHGEPEFELAGLGLGAADYIAKPAHEALLVARVRHQLQVKQRLDTLSQGVISDDVTGVANARTLIEQLNREWRRSMRTGSPLALLRADIDAFGAVVEHQGPARAAECLRRVATTLQNAALRPGDLVARCGPHAFALLLPHTRQPGAEHLAHRILDAVEALNIPHPCSHVSRHVTLSVGLSVYDESSPCWRGAAGAGGPGMDALCASPDLSEAAEKALSAARLAGGGQAWSLEIGSIESPGAAREIGAEHRAPQRRR